jgi:glycosyltransferase involved in cell wall biosynthesis
MKNNKTVIMAEFSDVRYDARVLKEAYHLSNKKYKVLLFMYNTDIEKDIVYKKNNILYHVYSFLSRRENDSTKGIIKKYFQALKYVISVNIKILFTRAEYYHAHNLKFLFISFLSSILHNGKLVYDAHELHSEHYDNIKVSNRIKNMINMIMERIVLLRCHAFIQASDERAVYIAKKYRINIPVVINNYVPINQIDKNGKYDLKTELDIKNNYPILFYSGGIYEDRFFAFTKILRAIREIEKINLVIVGFMNEDIKTRFKKLKKQYHLDDQLFFLGPVPNEKIVKIASSADIGLIPLTGNSVNTKLSALNKISEYLMSGLPLLCSNYNNLKKIIKDNPIGTVGDVFDVDKTQSIKNSIQKIIKDDYYKTLKKNALQLAHQYYNWNTEVKKLDIIYATND